MRYYNLHPSITAFSTTRQGGVSIGNYASFNINHYCGDSPEAVRKNQQLLSEQLGIAVDRLVYPHQTHQTEVRQITPDFFTLTEEKRQAFLEGVDAVFTDVIGICIGVSTADCIPIIIYDPTHHAVATVHAGWRGTVARIAEKAVSAMTHTVGSLPEEMQAVIGPGISLKNFEVGDEVYDAFRDAGFAMDMIAKRFQSKWHIDLPLCNSMQLQTCGLQKEKIQITDICTYDNYHDFFSARRLGINSGRIFTGALLH